VPAEGVNRPCASLNLPGVRLFFITAQNTSCQNRSQEYDPENDRSGYTLRKEDQCMTRRLGWFSVCLIVSTTLLSPLLGQVDSGILRARYGPPIEEVFDVWAGIAMTVIYGDNHQACKLEIRPTPNAPSAIPATVIQQVVDEVIPASTRGTPKQQFFQCGGAVCWELTEYEGMSIGQAAGDVTPNPQAPTQNSLAVIQFKSCQPQVDSGTLPARYGPPAEEVFDVRLGVAMAVTYGDNHQACKIDIRPTRKASAIPVALIEQLVDEILAPVIRGTLKGRSGTCDGGCWMTTEYDNLRIGQERGNPARDDGGGTVTPNPDATKQSSLAVIQFKSCQVPKQ
jgi:hypothetical protein